MATNKLPCKPLGRRVLIEVKRPERSTGGIVMPETAALESEYRARAFGDGAKECGISIDDQVILKHGVRFDAVPGNTLFWIVDADDISGVMTK